MYTTKLSLKKLSLVATAAVLFLGACKKEEATVAPVEEASIFIKHVSPDAPSVDLLVDGTKVNTTPVTFNSNTGYLKVKAGARNIKINNAATNATILNRDITLVKDKNYTLFAANRLSALEPVLVEDNLAAPAAGKAHVRFVHLSPDATSINVVNGTSTTNMFTALGFKSVTSFTAVDATSAGSSFTFNVRNASTNASITSVPATLSAGKIYTIIIRGFATPPANNTNALGATLVTNK